MPLGFKVVLDLHLLGRYEQELALAAELVGVRLESLLLRCEHWLLLERDGLSLLPLAQRQVHFHGRPCLPVVLTSDDRMDHCSL